MTRHKREPDDAIIFFDVGGDVDNFQHVLDMHGSQSMQRNDCLRFFLAKAVMHVCGFTPTFNIVNSVVDRIKSELRAEFRYQDTSRQEKIITDEWITLVESVRDNIRQYLYDNDQRNNKVATFRHYKGNGIISVILHDNDDEV